MGLREVGNICEKYWSRYFRKRLRELYRSEKRWLIVFSEIAGEMSGREVEQAVRLHLDQTVARVVWLEEVWRRLPPVGPEEGRLIRLSLQEAEDLLVAVVRTGVAVCRKVERERDFLRKTGINS